MIIVTGGAGFIGSALIKGLNDRGRTDIIVVDRMGKGLKWLNLRGLKYSQFIHADKFFDTDILSSFNIEAIYHMGACSSTTQTDVDYLMHNNVGCSRRLFTLAAQMQIPICYASSAATYGLGERGYSDEHKLIDELRPLNAYGYSKQVMDQWVLDLFERGKQKAPPKWFGVKFFNVFGPNEYHKGRMASVVYQAFQQISQTGQMKLFKSHRPDYGHGEQKRDFVYVLDVVNAMIDLMESTKKDISGIYNLGTGKARTFYDLVKATFVAMDKEENISFIDMPKDLTEQYQYFTQATVDKLYRALPGFRFQTLEQGVSDYVQNFLLTDNYYLDLHKNGNSKNV